MIDHHVVIFALPAPGLAPAFRLYVRTHMHVREVHPKEERLAGRGLVLDVLDGTGCDVIVDRLHPLLRQRAVSWTVCLPSRPKRGSTVASSLSVALQSNTPRGPNLSRKCGKSRGFG